MSALNHWVGAVDARPKPVVGAVDASPKPLDAAVDASPKPLVVAGVPWDHLFHQNCPGGFSYTYMAVMCHPLGVS